MKALKLEGTSVREIEIENSIPAIQDEVLGFYETIPIIKDQAIMIINEKRMYLGMRLNLSASAISGQTIVGPALVVGADGDEFCDIPSDISALIRLRWR